MEIKLFSDMLDTLAKIGGGIKALANLPKSKREKYRETLAETYRLIDVTLNMVINRLWDILREKDDQKFLQEVINLEYYPSWYEAERSFRLCQALRASKRETETMRSELVGRMSAKDWDALLGQMQAVLTAENQVANYIGHKFLRLATFAGNLSPTPESMAELRGRVSTFKDSLMAERQQLLQQEVELYEIL